MNNLSLEEIKIIIETGNFETLVGKVENEFFECKGSIYILDEDSGKRELAKDITSFANLTGGYILIGPQTDKNEKHLGDEVIKISYLEECQINIKQYYDVIKEWVYPEIQGLNIFWQANNNSKKNGIFIIYIQNQSESLKPFLIKRTIDGKKKSEIIFGYAERRRDNSAPKDIASIHTLLRDGINYSKNIDGRFSKIEAMLGEVKKKEILNKKEKILQYVAESLIDSEMSKFPNFNLIAYPEQSVELKTIFSNQENSIKRKLENPPELRYAGWGLGTLDTAQIREGKFIRVKNGERKIIDLHKNGVLIFNALANDEFLSWGNSKNEFKLNPLAMIESICNFVIFYNGVLKDCNNSVTTVGFYYSFNNLWVGANKYFLTPYALDSSGYRFNDYKKDAPKPSVFSEPIIFQANKFNNLGEIVYKIVEEIYLWFGISTDDGKVPYTTNIDGVTMIDIERIKNIR